MTRQLGFLIYNPGPNETMSKLGSAVIGLALLGGVSMGLPEQPSERIFEIYVSPLGSDTTGDGTLARPYGTLARAATAAGPGSRILLRGGVYRQARQILSNRGTSSEPIRVRPYPGERVVFDAEGIDLEPEDAVIELADAAHLTLSGLVVRNSRGRGIALKRVEAVEVSDCTVHDIAYRAIGGHGRDIRILDNHVYHAALMNTGGGRSGGWPAAISTWSPPGRALTRGVTIRGNQIHEIWGEGIIALLLEDGIIEGNTIHDTFGSAIYVDTARRITIRANHVWMADERFQRASRFATGVNMAAECCHPWGTVLLEDILIANNLFSGTGRGIHFWHDGSNRTETNSYRNVGIFFNVFFANAEVVIGFDRVPRRYRAPSGSEVRNNIIYSGSNGTTIDLGQPEAWRFSHNVWPDGIPASGRGRGSLAVDPAFVRVPAVDAEAESFKLLPGSPLEGAGIYVERVPIDMWGSLRKQPPTIGLFEPDGRDAN